MCPHAGKNSPNNKIVAENLNDGKHKEASIFWEESLDEPSGKNKWNPSEG